MRTDPRIIEEAVTRLGAKGDKPKSMVKCPFHDDTNPSMLVVLTPGDEHVHCFSTRCGYHANLTKLLADLDGVKVEDVLTRFGLADNRRHRFLRRFTEKAAELLLEGGLIRIESREIGALEYLTKARKHAEATLRRFKVGCTLDWDGTSIVELLPEFKERDWKRYGLLDKSGRFIFDGAVVFPVVRGGTVVGLRFKFYGAKKRLGQLPHKHWLSKMPLFNADVLHSGDTVYIVEGEDDVLQIEARGFRAVGLCGTLTGEKVQILRRAQTPRFVIAVDNDEAGEEMRRRLAAELQSVGKEVKIYVPKLKDVDEELRQGDETVFKAAEEPPFYIIAENNRFILNGGDGKALSDFVFDVEGKVVFGRNRALRFLLRFSDPLMGEMRRILVAPSELLEVREFNRVVGRIGWGRWQGSANQLRDLVSYLSRSAPTLQFVDHIGRVFDIEGAPQPIFCWENAILTEDQILPFEAVFSQADHPGFYFEVPSVSNVAYPLDTKIDKTEAEDRVRALFEKLPLEHRFILGWFISVAWQPQFRRDFSYFPLLWVSGEQGAGKTTLVTLFQALYARREGEKEPSSIYIERSRATPEGLSRALAIHSGFPVLLDDHRETLARHDEFQAVLRAAYDGGATVKGTTQTSEELKNIDISVRLTRAAVVVTSQHPPEDQALFERVLYLELKKASKDPALKQEIRRNLDALTVFGASIIRRSFTEPFQEGLPKPLVNVLRGIRLDRSYQGLATSCAGLIKAGLLSPDEALRLFDSIVQAGLGQPELVSEVDHFLSLVEDAMTYDDSVVEGKMFGEMRDGRYWIAVGSLYDRISIRNRSLPYTKKAINSLFIQRGGKSAVIKIRSDFKWVSVRVKIFDRDSPIAAKIRQWLGERSDEEEYFDF